MKKKKKIYYMKILKNGGKRVFQEESAMVNLKLCIWSHSTQVKSEKDFWQELFTFAKLIFILKFLNHLLKENNNNNMSNILSTLFFNPCVNKSNNGAQKNLWVE